MSFCGYISRKITHEKRSIFDKNHGLTPLQIFYFLDFFQTFLFRSKKHSFLSRISKNDLLCLDFPKKKHLKKCRFFHKTMESPLCKFSIFWVFFFSTWLFRSKKYSFVSNRQKTIFCGQISPNKHIWEKGGFFGKNYGLTPLQVFYFLDFF